jgi:hypothetical protein
VLIYEAAVVQQPGAKMNNDEKAVDCAESGEIAQFDVAVVGIQ